MPPRSPPKTIAILAVAIIAIALGVLAGSALAQVETGTPPVETTATTPPPTTPQIVVKGPDKICSSAHKFRAYAKKIYAKDKISKSELDRIYQLRRCLKPWALEFQRNLGKQRRHRLEIKRLTPYAGPNGTRWAVPWSIVNCERDKKLGISGIWGSDNPTSDARGPYQLLGHGEPWPANTPARKLAHHRIAGNLFRSQGYGPWKASQGCWG